LGRLTCVAGGAVATISAAARALACHCGLYVPGNRHEKAAIMKRAPAAQTGRDRTGPKWPPIAVREWFLPQDAPESPAGSRAI
jgi:hypothetical protein